MYILITCLSFFNLFFPAGSEYFKCDHQRSVFLYIASLNESCSVVTFPCETYKDYRIGKCVDCRVYGSLGCPVLGNVGSLHTLTDHFVLYKGYHTRYSLTVQLSYSRTTSDLLKLCNVWT